MHMVSDLFISSTSQKDEACIDYFID